MSTRKAVEKQGIALVEGIPNYSAQVEDDGKIASLATNDDADPAPTTEGTRASAAPSPCIPLQRLPSPRCCAFASRSQWPHWSALASWTRLRSLRPTSLTCSVRVRSLLPPVQVASTSTCIRFSLAVKTVASVLKGKLFTKAKTLFIGATIYYQGTTFKVVAMDQHTDATGKDFREWQFHLIEPVSGPVHGVAALDKPHKWDGKKIAKAEVMHMPA